MIISQMHGGMGNQLFQYAFARNLAEKNKTQLRLDTVRYLRQVFSPAEALSPKQPEVLTNSVVTKLRRRFFSPMNKHFFRGDGLREYKLFHFDIQARPLSTWELVVLNIKQRLLHSFTFVNHESAPQNFHPELLALQGDVYLLGFWQSEKYFQEIAPLIRKELKIVTPPTAVNQQILTQIQSVEAVSLHVRRGDYVSDSNVNKNFGTCTPQYYAEAIRRIKAEVANPHFFVFSDDPDWAEANIKPDAPVTYIRGNGAAYDYEDLRLMYSCKHFIIANSSFSWWGAWLSDNASKIVFAPQRWFARDDVDTSDIIPDGWIKINA